MTDRTPMIQGWDNKRQIMTKVRIEEQALRNELMTIYTILLLEEGDEFDMFDIKKRKEYFQTAFDRIMKYQTTLEEYFKNVVIQNRTEASINDELTLQYYIHEYIKPQRKDLIDKKLDMLYQEKQRIKRLTNTRIRLKKTNSYLKTENEDTQTQLTEKYCKQFRMAIEGTNNRAYLFNQLPRDLSDDESDYETNWPKNYEKLRKRNDEYKDLKKENDRLKQENQRLQNIINTGQNPNNQDLQNQVILWRNTALQTQQWKISCESHLNLLYQQ
jgi:hypothetical protein